MIVMVFRNQLIQPANLNLKNHKSINKFRYLINFQGFYY
jgi:hypothetical protein